MICPLMSKMVYKQPDAQGYGGGEQLAEAYCQTANCPLWVDDEANPGCAIKAIAERLPK